MEIVYVRFNGPTKYTGHYDDVSWSTGPNGSLRRCDANAKSLAHFNKDGRRSMRHAMPIRLWRVIAWRMAAETGRYHDARS
jgi:hypothetical protein